ncbi:MAG: addiction module protein [Verrucomicrobiae bacterium]|nr:addiction module protein [Verrucomicrobiae bacterium]MCP5542000.1 addiction module protein [Akkermansiaceae bacterium]
MILERLPEVRNLSPEEKEILADELWADLGHSNHSDPDIKPLLERLLQQRGEDESIPWETLRKQIGVAP